MNHPESMESAAQLAARVGDSLIDPADVGAEEIALVSAVRSLVQAAGETDVEPQERSRIALQLDGLTAELASSRRHPVILLGRHSNGRVENLTQAGSGRLNPQALPVEFGEVPGPPPPGVAPRSVEITATCVFSSAHSGPPGRIHGGVAATVLDEVLGVAATAAGATGVTGSLTIRYEAPTPYGITLEARARYTHSDGRKHFATGELVHDGAVTASAEAIFIAPRE